MVFRCSKRRKNIFWDETDTSYHGDFQHPTVEQSDVDYLLEVVNNRYPEVQLTIDDIEASWAARPLISANGGSEDYNGETMANFQIKVLMKSLMSLTDTKKSNR